MPRYATIEKREGETPLQALERLRQYRPALADAKLAYAGRLDPMASGTLLVLVGEECKNQTMYHALDKQYDFDVLLGCASDTGDVLGLVCRGTAPVRVTGGQARAVAARFRGPWRMPYPVYSSKPVAGKPLFQHAYDGTLDTITLPTADVRIHALHYRGMRSVAAADLAAVNVRRISSLELDANRPRPGDDFRQSAAVARWRTIGAHSDTYTILRFRATVSAGTYIRALAPAIAEALGGVGLAHSIHRRRIGRYTSLPLGGVWYRTY